MFTISTNSWHYKVANRYRNAWSKFDVAERVTFCKYFNSVIWSLFLTTVIATLSAWFIFGNIIAFTLLLGGSWHFLTGELTWPAITLVILVFVSCVVGLANAAEKLEQRKERRELELHKKSMADLLNPPEPREPKPPGFFRMWLTTIREKVCFMVEFK